MSDVEIVWSKLEIWLAANAPAIRENLNEGASKNQISRLEKRLGVDLPEDYKVFLQRCNGRMGGEVYWFYESDLLSIKGVISTWELWNDMIADEPRSFKTSKIKSDLGIRREWWNPKWIPITYGSKSDDLYIDLDPDKGGTPGQIISVHFDSPKRELKHPSFTDWLEHVLTGVETCQIVYDAKEHLALVYRRDAK
jgi:cell wall assembly regulator SMI1